MKYFYLLLCCLFLFSCKKSPKKDAEKPPQRIETPAVVQLKSNKMGKKLILAAVDDAGVQKLVAGTLSYTVDGDRIRIERNCGQFAYSHITKNDKGQSVERKLTNLKFQTITDNKARNLPDSTAGRFVRNLKSEVYFMEFPFGMNSPRVRKRFLKKDSINGKAYDLVKLAFIGNDRGAKFVKKMAVWIDAQENRIAYMAYAIGTDQTELRFKEAYNFRRISGIRFSDYMTYAPKKNGVLTLKNMGQAFATGKLEKTGETKAENIQVKLSKRSCG